MRRINRLSTAIAFCTTASLATETLAAGMLEEIIVTATRRQESLQEVPIAVTAMSTDTLDELNITKFADISPGMIPGVFSQGFAGNQSIMTFHVRGTTTADGSQGMVEMAVPIYIDGVFLGRSQGAGVELIDPERIEILRGPQGQLFGRNAEGGVVQYISRKPTGEFGFSASASLGNFDDQKYKLSVDLPEVAGFSVALAAMKSKHDPYTPQGPVGTYAGYPYVPASGPTDGYNLLDGVGYRLAVRWQSEDDAVTIDYTYDDTDQDDSQGYLTWSPVNTTSTLAPPSILPPNPYAAQSDWPDKTFALGNNQLFETYAQGHAATVQWDVSPEITLKSITSYRETGREGASQLGEALPVIAGYHGVHPAALEILDAESFSQELQFIGSWDRFSLTAGAIYYEEEVDDVRISILSGPLAAAFIGADWVRVGDNRQTAKTESWGVYAQGTYQISDRMEIVLGARYSDDLKKANRYVANFAPVDINSKFSEQRVDPAATIRYEFSDDVSAYARWATGYRAGGVNVRSSAFNSFQEETSQTWELGVKSRMLDQRLQVNAALYYNVIEDEALTIQEAPTVNPSLTNTINSQKDKKITGLEVESSFAATDQLTLNLNFSYMDINNEIWDLVNPFDPSGNTVQRFWAQYVPEWSGSVGFVFEQPMSIGTIVASMNYAWADDYWTTAGAQDTKLLLPNYERPTSSSSQLTARLALTDIEVGDGRFEVALWGKNLTDDSSRNFAFDGCDFNRGFCGFRAYPRTYGVEAKYSYE